MSKQSVPYASSRLRLRKESSAAQRKPTNKKSLSSSLSTVLCQCRKAIGWAKKSQEPLGYFRAANKELFEFLPGLDLLPLDVSSACHTLTVQVLTKIVRDLEALERKPRKGRQTKVSAKRRKAKSLTKPWEHEG